MDSLTFAEDRHLETFRALSKLDPSTASLLAGVGDEMLRLLRERGVPLYLEVSVNPVTEEAFRRERRAFSQVNVDPKDAELLRLMAANCAHSEVGGRAIREQSDTQAGGDVVGRTQWIGKPDWAMDYSREEIETAVAKAIEGARLGKRQETLIEVMLSEIKETRANCAPQVVAPDRPF